MSEREVEKIEVIRTTLTIRGSGTDDNPHRVIVQYWSLSGDFLAEVDPGPRPKPVAFDAPTLTRGWR